MDSRISDIFGVFNKPKQCDKKDDNKDNIYELI